MKTKVKILIANIAIFAIIGGIVAYIALSGNNDDAASEVEVTTTYNHDTAVATVVSSGCVDESAANIELGMSQEEVDVILGESGVIENEVDSTKKVVYSAENGYELEVIFESDEVVGIAVVKE